MTQYRRAFEPGGTWFFTVNLAERAGNRLLVEQVDALRSAFRTVRAAHAFRIDAIVILPDHLHCIWTLRVNDSDFLHPVGADQSKFLSFPYEDGIALS
jgi:putative transposase